MKRSGVIRRTPLSRARLRAKPKPDDGYAQARHGVHGRAKSRCERCGDHLPFAAVHAHHRKPRSAGRDDSVPNLLALCRACHTHVHANPAESYRCGWLIRRSDFRAPEMVPVRVWQLGWALLTPEGGVRPLQGYGEPLD